MAIERGSQSTNQRGMLFIFVAACTVHSAQSHYFAAAPGYPSTYANLHANQYGLLQQQVWPEHTVEVVQVQPPQFHGKLFQKSLFPIWARSVGLAAGNPTVYAPAASYVSAYPIAAAPTAYHTALAYPTALHTLVSPLAVSPSSENPASGAHISPVSNAPAAMSDEKASPAADTQAAAPGGTDPAFAALPTAVHNADGQSVASPTDNAPGVAATALPGLSDSTQDAAAPTTAYPVTSTVAGIQEESTTGVAQDLEPSVDSGATNNHPSFLGAPNRDAPVSVSVPEPDGKRVVVYQFPNLLEGLVQRFQNYFSTYNHITTTSISNAVSNSNSDSNSTSNSDSKSTSNSDSKSNSESDSKSDSKSESDSKSKSDSDSKSGSDSGSDSNSGSASLGGTEGGKAEPVSVEARPDAAGQFGQSVAAPEHDTHAPATPQPSQPTNSFPATTQHPLSTVPHHTAPHYSTPARPQYHASAHLDHPAPSGGRYGGSEPVQQLTIYPPQKAYSYELFITKSTTPAPFQGYSYSKPRIPFDPYRQHEARLQQQQRQQQYQAERTFQGPQNHHRNDHNNGNGYNGRQGYSGYHYPRH